MHILLTNVHLDCRGEGSGNRNASRDESVETGDESVETGDESVEAGEKTPQSCYNISAMYYTRFSLCCGSSWFATGQFYPYFLRLHHHNRDNRIIVYVLSALTNVVKWITGILRGFII